MADLVGGLWLVANEPLRLSNSADEDATAVQFEVDALGQLTIHPVSGEPVYVDAGLDVHGDVECMSNLLVDGDTHMVGNLGVGAAVVASVRLFLAAGSASLAPLAFSPGTLLTLPADGRVEYDGSAYYASVGTDRQKIARVTDNVASATKLQTARTIGGVSFDGTGNITVASATGGFAVSGGDLALGANNLTLTGAVGATGARSSHGWFTDLTVTNAIAGSVSGSAATLATPRTIWGQSFDGSANVSGAFSGATTIAHTGQYTQNHASSYAQADLNGAAGFGARIRFGEATGGYLAQIAYNLNVGQLLEFYGGGTGSGNVIGTWGATSLAVIGALTATSSWGMVSGQKFYYDGVVRTGDTYRYESSANVLDDVVGGVNQLRMTATSAKFASGVGVGGQAPNNSISINMPAPGYVFFGTEYAVYGDSSSAVLRAPSGGSVYLRADATDVVTVASSLVTINIGSTRITDFVGTGGAEINLYASTGAAGVDHRRWGLFNTGTDFLIRRLNDAYSTGVNWFRITDAGNIGMVSGKKFFVDGEAATGDTWIYEQSANAIALVTAGATAFRAEPNQNCTFGAHALIQSGFQLYLDGGGDTYIYERAANVMSFVADGLTWLESGAGGGWAQFLTITDLLIPAAAKLRLDGNLGGDTYIYESSANILAASAGTTGGGISLQINGSERFFVENTQISVESANFIIPSTKKLLLDGSGTGDTYISEAAANDLRFTVGGSTYFKIVSALGGLAMTTATPFYIDGGSNTYLDEPSGDILRFVLGGVESFLFDGATALTDGDTALRILRRAAGASSVQRVKWKDFSSLAAGDKVMILGA